MLQRYNREHRNDEQLCHTSDYRMPGLLGIESGTSTEFPIGKFRPRSTSRYCSLLARSNFKEKCSIYRTLSCSDRLR